MVATLGDGDPKDFDETRRLLYMVLMSPHTKRYELAGTVVNALVHHHAVDVTAEEAASYLLAVIEQDASASGSGDIHANPDLGDPTAGAAWVKEQIARITEQRKDGAASS